MPIWMSTHVVQEVCHVDHVFFKKLKDFFELTLNVIFVRRWETGVSRT